MTWEMAQGKCRCEVHCAQAWKCLPSVYIHVMRGAGEDLLTLYYRRYDYRSARERSAALFAHVLIFSIQEP